MKIARLVRPSGLRVTCAAWALVASWGVAAEPAKNTAASAEVTAAESIAATKRDLERIRGASDPRFQGSANAAAPRVAVPELRIDSVESSMPPVAPTATKRASTPEKNAGNWLVDAMEQGARERDERQRGAMGVPRWDERDARQPSELGPTTSGQPSRAGEPRLPGSERERTPLSSLANAAEKRPATTNPLAPYLSEWLTPHDYALLRPGIAAEAAGQTGAGVSDFRNGVGSELASALGAPTLKRDIPGGFGPAPMPRSPAPLRENPFLTGLIDPPRTVSPPAATQPSIVATPSAVSDRLAIPMGTPQTPSISPRIPDVAKPRPDETYFKQLKRF